MANSSLTNEEREKFIRLCHAAQIASLSGKFEEAHLYYRHAARLHPYSTTVWMGLAKIVEDDADRRVALQNVLAIDSSHQEARQMLEDLDADTGN